jgi:hypothetical protein
LDTLSVFARGQRGAFADLMIYPAVPFPDVRHILQASPLRPQLTYCWGHSLDAIRTFTARRATSYPSRKLAATLGTNHKMPLTRYKIIGFDPKSMVYRFLMRTAIDLLSAA